MVITSNYNSAKLLAELRAEQRQNDDLLYEEMKQICNDFVTAAREQPEGHELGYYNNLTFRLRHSIGAYIFRDGALAYVNDERPENMDLIRRELIVRKGFTIVGIAGMYYASWVESKGYNVIYEQSETLIVDLSSAFLRW